MKTYEKYLTEGLIPAKFKKYIIQKISSKEMMKKIVDGFESTYKGDAKAGELKKMIDDGKFKDAMDLANYIKGNY